MVRLRLPNILRKLIRNRAIDSNPTPNIRSDSSYASDNCPAGRRNESEDYSDAPSSLSGIHGPPVESMQGSPLDLTSAQRVSLHTFLPQQEHDKGEVVMRGISRSVSRTSFGRIRRSLGSSTPELAAMAVETQKRLASDWEHLLSRVHKFECPRHNGFLQLQPQEIIELTTAAILGPIVVINIEEGRCDAEIIRYVDGSLRMDCVYLHSVSLEKVNSAHHLLTRASSSLDAHSVGPPILSEVSRDFPSVVADTKGSNTLRHIELDDDRTSALIFMRRMPQILQMLWKDIVEPIFQALGFISTGTSNRLSRVTWCTKRPLAFLPPHAAGCYSQDGSASDARAYKYAVSSYAPDLSTLLYTLKRMGSTFQDFRGIAAVSQPSTPNRDPLPGTVDEVKKIQNQFDAIEFTWLNGAAATRDAVLHQMKECSWIHLACHGIQSQTNPMENAFILHDGPLDLSTISRETMPHARVAFLSSCQTARGDENLLEEAAHLAAGMLMSGYHTVIGTMWPIKDEDTPIVAEEFYKYMKIHEMKTDDGQAAYALHQAVARLREKVGENNFFSWIPFIHLGI